MTRRLSYRGRVMRTLILAVAPEPDAKLSSFDHPEHGREPIDEVPVMGNEEQGAGEFPEDGFEGFPTGKIEMVGRLVEEEKVGTFQREERQSEATPLPTAQGTDRLDNLVTLEEKARSETTCLLLVQCMLAKQRFEDGASFVQAWFLREKGELDPIAIAERTGQGSEFSSERPQECRLPGAVGADDRDPLAALNDEFRRPQEHRAGITDHQWCRRQDCPAARPALNERELESLHYARGLQPLESCQFRCAATSLASPLTGSIALDERFLLADVLLLLFVRGQPLREALGTEFEISGIIARIFFDPTEAELECPRRDLVEEVPVVRDDEDGPAPALEEGLQPGQGREIEMIGRLVKEKQIGIAQKRSREREAGPLTTTEVLNRPGELGLREPESG